uniref:Yeast cell wall synthesis Kre9/Knh1-like N-terminal domain-containing protein n=1 Tax=Mycena chlorophos TaxID=658473 RepID=A0ABQ0LUA4_MYCCL|nr:predicted protein [Mycena chlorophos]
MPFHIQHDGPAPISTYFLVEAAPDQVAKPVPPPATQDEMQVDSVEDATLPRRVTDATTRFLATFRGRTMHGLKMALPEGYTGVIFNGGAGSPTAKAGVKPKSKAKPKRAGRATRSATRLDDEDEEMETAEARPLEPAARFSSFVLWTPDIPVDLGRDDYGRSLSEWISLAKEIHRVDERLSSTSPLASCRRRRPSLHNSVRFAPASPPQNMFSSVVLATILASNALLSHADVTPNEPAPGDSFNEGASCTLGWAGDTNSTTNWLNMAIELMTGPNEAMVHLTTVATGQDGTKAGTFSYTCPGVTLNAPVYFYQFTAPGTPDYQWTGRFTIAATNGSSVAAPQTEQSDGTTVHFGTATSAPVNTAAAGGGPAPAANSTHSSLPTSASAGASQSSGTSAAVAVGPLSLDTRMMPVAAALLASVVAGTMLL